MMHDAEYQRGVRERKTTLPKTLAACFSEVIHSSDITWEAKSSFEHGYNSTIIAHLDATCGAGTWDRIYEENQAYRLDVYQRCWPGLGSAAPNTE